MEMQKWMHLLWLIPVVICVVYLCYRLIMLFIQDKGLASLAKIEGMEDKKEKEKEKEKENKKEDSSSSSKSTLRVVYFHASWCRFCQDFKPTWEKLIKNAEIKYPASKFESYDVDDAANAAIVKTYGVSSLPDIRFITSKNEERYKGDRSLPAMVKAVHDADQQAQKAAQEEK
jgi:thiol-disulfide isomerase/thioredoxin